jgi:2-amino-4-hydroxy-6-hydroxymethyldihydropteridine diphosphokinase/dihydroneopterin aldolase
VTTAFGTGVTGLDGRSLDQVQLTGVSARGYHGVLPSERQAGQEFVADVVLYLDTRPAAAGDDLAQTVSYAEVAQDVHDVLAGEPADLVETVAERIAAVVLARPQVEAVDVRVHKPQAPIPVPFADVEVAIRRDRSHLPVVAAPASPAGAAGAAPGTGSGVEAAALDPVSETSAAAGGYESGPQDVFPVNPPLDSWNDGTEHTRGELDSPSLAGRPEAQDLEPVARPAQDEPAQFEPEPFQPEPYQPYPSEQTEQAQLRAEAFEPEPLVDRVPASAPSAAEPEPAPVPELIAPEPLQVVPATWELPPEVSAHAERRDELGQEPAFRPNEQFLPGQAFEPVQQYESVQGLDQRNDQPNGFEQQQYDQFAQQPDQPQHEQQYDQFAQPGQVEQAQRFERAQPGYEQPQQQHDPQQLDPQQNQYDQLFEQHGDMPTTQVAAAVPDPAVGQPEQYAQEPYQPDQYQAEPYPAAQQQSDQYQSDQYQAEPRDRFDEVPAGYVDVVIAIGANLGDPQATMRSAVAELDRMPGLQITDVSPLARTAAVGGPEEQPDYLNAVLLARTTLSARGLLHLCQEVENVHGRVREEHWGPRTLDVDLIAYGNLTDSAEDLEVPHPRAHERAFVLEPWSQIAPDAVLPGLGGGPVAQLAATAPDRAGIRWLALDWLTDPEPEQDGGTTGSNHPAVPDDGGAAGQEVHAGQMPPALPPSLPPAGRPQASPGGPVVEVPGGGHPQGQHSGQVELDRQPQGGAPQQQHPQSYSSGPVPGADGSAQAPQGPPLPARGARPAGMPGNGSAVPPPEEALVPAPIAPRAVRDTAHEAPAHEPLPPASAQPKPVFAPVNPSRQQSGVFPPVNGGGTQEQGGPVFAPVSTPPNGVSDQAPNGQPNGQQDAYDNDHTVIRVPGFVGDQRTPPPSDGPIDSVPSWVPVRDERGRDA